MLFRLAIFIASGFLSFAPLAHGEELIQDKVEMLSARVLEVVTQEKRTVPGTAVETEYQNLSIEILDGKQAGEVLTIENDYILLEPGDQFFLRHTIDGLTGRETYSVQDVDRRGVMTGFLVLFLLVILMFSGKQGIRSIVSLAGSLLVIVYVLLPSLLAGYSAVPTSIAIAVVILFFAIFLTHGFNRESAVAFAGTVLAVVITGILAHVAVTTARLTGFASDEAVYLNLNTRGALDFAGLLLGGIMIGVLGVLDDIAITQTAVVSELYASAPHLARKEAYRKALRVGREHVGALVNTLALAYTGASLPLLLLFSGSSSPASVILNQELFAVEILRTTVGSIGLILTVPITTLLAVYFLEKQKADEYV